jgi:hypothetical protein
MAGYSYRSVADYAQWQVMFQGGLHSTLQLYTRRRIMPKGGLCSTLQLYTWRRIMPNGRLCLKVGYAQLFDRHQRQIMPNSSARCSSVENGIGKRQVCTLAAFHYNVHEGMRCHSMRPFRLQLCNWCWTEGMRHFSVRPSVMRLWLWSWIEGMRCRSMQPSVIQLS